MKEHPTSQNRRRLLAAAVALGAVASLPSAFAQTAGAARATADKPTAARRRLGALAGVVVNNNIVLIDTYDSLRREGRPKIEAILQTCRERARPVVLTALTAIDT